MTLLSAINGAQRRLSLPVTSTVVADGQETQNLLYALANEEASDILARDDYDFPLLRRTQSFTASLASLQSSGKPSNFQRAISETFWNQTADKKMYGPLRDQEWAYANGEALISSTWQSVMFRYDGLHVYPVPTVAETMTYDYIINTPVLAVDGTTYKTEFTVDTDSYLLGDRILRLGIIWRYKADKGRDYAEDMRNYELALAALYRSQVGAARVLSIAPEETDWPPEGDVPDSGFGA